MKIRDIVEGYTVLPPIDKEKYQARDGLEGPFRLKNSKVVYYDPREGKYYDPDTDMYIDYDDYRKMDEEADVGSQIADLIRKKNSVSSPIARKNIDSQIAQLKKQRDKTKDVNEMDKSSNDYSGWGHSKHEVSNGPDKTAKMMKAKDAIKAARKTLDKAFDNSKKGVAEGDKRPEYVVKASDKPKKVKPSLGGSSKHPYQGKLVGEAEVGATDYEFAHGKKPKGHGSWFFVAHRGGINFSKDVEGEDYIQLHQMSYGDAKKAAIKWAKSKGHTSLFVAT